MNIYTTKITNIFRVQKQIEDSNLPLHIPPWKLLKPDVDTSFSDFKKNETNKK